MDTPDPARALSLLVALCRLDDARTALDALQRYADALAAPPPQPASMTTRAMREVLALSRFIDQLAYRADDIEERGATPRPLPSVG